MVASSGFRPNRIRIEGSARLHETRTRSKPRILKGNNQKRVGNLLHNS